ncbi:MAG: Succinate dehydrogenase hydrophobic membrane anchor protein, partial [uncultured Lysobacter sp.]
EHPESGSSREPASPAQACARSGLGEGRHAALPRPANYVDRAVLPFDLCGGPRALADRQGLRRRPCDGRRSLACDAPDRVLARELLAPQAWASGHHRGLRARARRRGAAAPAEYLRLRTRGHRQRARHHPHRAGSL